MPHPRINRVASHYWIGPPNYIGPSRAKRADLCTGREVSLAAGPREVASIEGRSHYRLVIADDHPLFRGALREAVSDCWIVWISLKPAPSMRLSTARTWRRCRPDLSDLDDAGCARVFRILYLRAQYPSVPVIVVSANDDPAVIRRCMEFGASASSPRRSASKLCAGDRGILGVGCGRRRRRSLRRVPMPNG